MFRISKRHWLRFLSIAVIAALLNLLPYLLTRGSYGTDGYEIAGFPLVFWRFGGFAGTSEFHPLALFVNILIGLLAAAWLSRVCVTGVWPMVDSKPPSAS